MTATDWKKLAERPDQSIRDGLKGDPEAAPTDAAFWEKARVKLPDNKKPITIRLDADVLEWFQAEGRGYQTRINAVLRSYVEAKRNSP